MLNGRKFKDGKKKMKLIILGGFLGSGKTSILMPLAQQIVEKCGNDGESKNKLAIIENEVGNVGIDQVFAEGAGYSTRELFSGCVCCTLVSSLLDCLCEIEKNEKPDWVILEATGLAYPSDIAENIWEYYDEDMSITTCIIADCSRWEKISKAVGELVTGQLEDANYVLLNKCDLVDDGTLNKVKESIEKVTNGKLYEFSALKNPEECRTVCGEIVDEINSWD